MLLGRTGGELPSRLPAWDSSGSAGHLCEIKRTEASLPIGKSLTVETVPEYHSDMASSCNHPTSGTKRKHKSPATRAADRAVGLVPPVLPESLRGDDGDGPSGSEEEKDAKRMLSTSTTPRSGRGKIPTSTIRSWDLPQCKPLKWSNVEL